MRVIIAGSRGFTNKDKLYAVCDVVLKDKEDIVILSGRAKGADTLGEKYAEDRGHQLALYPADWNVYGKSAGYRRNLKMAEFASILSNSL